jgi:hypothetical protein
MHVQGAKRHQFRFPSAPFNPVGQFQLVIAELILAMRNLRISASGVYARAMQHHGILFIFQKGIRAGIEYRV